MSARILPAPSRSELQRWIAQFDCVRNPRHYAELGPCEVCLPCRCKSRRAMAAARKDALELARECGIARPR